MYFPERIIQATLFHFTHITLCSKGHRHRRVARVIVHITHDKYLHIGIILLQRVFHLTNLATAQLTIVADGTTRRQVVDNNGHMLVCQRTANYQEATSGTSTLDVVLLLIYIRYEFDITNRKQRRIVQQATVHTTMVGTLDVTELHVAGLQDRLITQVCQTMAIFNFADTNGSAPYLRQLVGTHLRKYTSHVVQLVGILQF